MIKCLVEKCHRLLMNNCNPKTMSCCNILFAQPHSLLHSSYVRSQKNENVLPSVFYYQNPLHWLRIKFQLYKLRKWDKEFSETDFKSGSKYAISSVTNIVSNQNLDDLEGLLTPYALSKLRQDVLVLWNDEIVRNIGLKLSDIKLAVPTKVHLRAIPLSHKRICDIDMWYMAMKWRDLDSLLIIDIVARFNNSFTNEQKIPEWTISFFELRKYYVHSYNT